MEKLIAPDGNDFDDIGLAVSVSGNVLVVDLSMLYIYAATLESPFFILKVEDRVEPHIFTT